MPIIWTNKGKQLVNLSCSIQFHPICRDKQIFLIRELNKIFVEHFLCVIHIVSQHSHVLIV
jgi:hypothetical protein